MATVVAGERAVCVVHGADGTWSALDNRCPHQGGPLGDGQLDEGWLICPWHAYQYDTRTGEPPPGFRDAATPYALRPVVGDEAAMDIEVPAYEPVTSLMDQVVDVLCDWGLEAVFGMVGHSNLGMADALRKAEADGRLTYVGIRHEGAAAFAASGYAKLTGNPAACFSIAGPGARAHGGGHGGGSDADAITVEPGDTGELTHTFDESGEFEIGCHEPGHYEAGMKIDVTVA